MRYYLMAGFWIKQQKENVRSSRGTTSNLVVVLVKWYAEDKTKSRDFSLGSFHFREKSMMSTMAKEKG